MKDKREIEEEAVGEETLKKETLKEETAEEETSKDFNTKFLMENLERDTKDRDIQIRVAACLRPLPPMPLRFCSQIYGNWFKVETGTYQKMCETLSLLVKTGCRYKLDGYSVSGSNLSVQYELEGLPGYPDMICLNFTCTNKVATLEKVSGGSCHIEL